MPLSVFFSNSLDALAEQFAQRLAVGWKDPFEPPVVIVPSLQAAHWLKERLLKKYGVDGIWTPTFLDRFIQKQIRVNQEQSGPQERRSITSAEQLQLSLLRLLQDTPPERFQWLYGPPGVVSVQPLPERLLQLSSGLARLFLEYFSSRTGLADAWLTGRTFFSEGKGRAEQEDEKFQRELYKKLLDNKEIWTIAHELLRWRRRPPQAPADKENASVHLFNVSGMGMVYHEILAAEAQRRDLYAYVLNPCAAFWEDVQTIRDLRRERRYSLKKLKAYRTESDPDENPLLRSWGDFGKRLIRMWSERAADYANTEYLEKPAIAEGEEGSVLQKIQQAVLFRMPGRMPGAAAAAVQRPDRSLEMIACKGKLRQFEVLRDWIVDLIRSERAASGALLDDIGVYLPDAASCAVEISMVFGAYPPHHPLHIPWAFEGKRSTMSRYAGAVRAYLALMDGPFTRPQVLDFVSNPLVMEKISATAADLAAWTGWIRSLNIFRGFDREHRGEVDGCDGTSPTWQQGIDRLLLGRIAAGVVSVGDRAFLPYRDIDTGDDACLCRFIRAIQGLWDDRKALEQTDGWKNAARLLGENLGQWLDPGDGAESAVRRDFLGALAAAAEVAGPPEVKGITAAAQLFLGWAASLLPEETAGRAGPGGVLLFRTMRTGNVFPCKYMALVNFGAVDFPGENAPRPLDLRPLRPQSDDTGPLEHNRHAFLEAVVSARDRLAIFYPSIDTASGEETAPSSTVLELLSAAGLDPKAFRTETPLCAEEGMGGSAQKVVSNPFPVMDGLARSLAGVTVQSSGRSADAGEAAVDGSTQPGPLRTQHRITLAVLKRWLEDPFTHRIGQALGRDDSGETVEALSDEEPFETGFLDCLSIVREVWERALKGAEKNEAVWSGYFESAYRQRQLECCTPDGFLGAIDRARLFEEVMAYLRVLRGEIPGNASAEQLRIRSARTAGAPEREGIVFNNVPDAGQSVVLEGAPQTGFWESAGSGTEKILHFFVPAYPRLSPDRRARYTLFPWLTAQAVAIGLKQDFSCVIHLIARETLAPVTIDIRHSVAAAYFEGVLKEYLNGTGSGHLPMQAVENITHGWGRQIETIDAGAVAQWLEADAESARPRYAYHSEFVDLLQPPVAGNAGEAVLMRYGPLIRACYPEVNHGAGDREAECSNA
jgi:exonuclease V gamma subunit